MSGRKRIAPELTTRILADALTYPGSPEIKAAVRQMKALLAIAADAHYLANHYAAEIRAGRQVCGSEANLMQSLRRLERASKGTKP